jgi:tripartite-type tricarboxylate transporter receptor subunit TctC
VTVGHGGVGGTGHLVGLLFLTKANIKGVLVSYRGTAPLITDLFGGHIDIGFPAYVPQISTVKALNVTSAERVSFLPNVPTLRESGVDVVATTWNGIMGPAGIPQDVVTKVNAALNNALKDEAVRKSLALLGAQPTGGSPQDFVRLIAKEKALWGPIIRAEHISID